MEWLAKDLGSRKPVIAMAHLPALPGSPLHDAAGGMAAIIEHVSRDIEALQAGGVDCIMFGQRGRQGPTCSRPRPNLSPP